VKAARMIPLALAVAATLVSTGAAAQGATAKPLRIVVPFTPGGGTDIVTRTLAPRLGERLGRQTIVDNRPGAAGTLGADLVARSAPDGGTMLMGSSSEIGIAPSLYAKLPYDVLRDFVAVAPVASTPMVLIVTPAMPVKNVRELVQLARTRPGEITFGSAGTGTGNHMWAEMFRHLTKTNLLHVPYKGAAPAQADVAGGQIQMMFNTLPAAVAFVKAGRVKALGISSGKRVPTLPDVPTMIEAGVPGFEVTYWYGLFAPAATPRDQTQRAATEVDAVLRSPEIGTALSNQGLEPLFKTPEQFTQFVRGEIEQWAVVVKASGTKLD
jgi:tripartite-type tricarboxylate transporter receptor subunit TctC